MRRGGLLYRTSADYDRATRSDNYDRDRFVPNTVRRAASTVKSVFGGTVTNENAGITVSAKDANTIREAWERADNASAGAHRTGTAAENEGDTRYSITDIKGSKRDYGKGVYLDTNIFDGVHPRNWNKTLSNYVYNNLAGKDVTIYDENGNSEQIFFAKEKERVTKDGAKNSHKVIDKLARTRGNTNMLSVVHIDELLQTATDSGSIDENSHQWLDKNGWKFKKAYVQDKSGNIYETILNIAKAQDGRSILYALSNTKKIDAGEVPSTREAGGARAYRQSSTNSITNPEGNVKTKFSVDTSEQTRTDIDNEYLDAVNRGDTATARRLVREQAERNGYSTDTDWRMDHNAPTREDDDPAYDLRGVYGEEIYSPMAARYYGTGAPFDQKAVNIIQSMKDNPEKIVSVYRAVPASVKDTRLRNGDWVTITEDYAKEHGGHTLGDDYRIIKNEVPAKYLFSDGNSIHEFGYDNGQAEAYRNTENNAKSLDTVTYDDNGNIIPLSQRFNVSNSDTRYSVDTNAESETVSGFGITNINDYIHVQRRVNNTLMKEGFFSDEGGGSRTVINADSGMVIEITPKGIKETFGEKNYRDLGKQIKIAKLLTVRDLPGLIENGKLKTDNEPNKHNPNSVLKYAYIEAETEIGGQPATVNIDIRKSPQKNKFWVHSVNFVQNNSGVPSQTTSGMGSNDSAANKIPQNNELVKRKFSVDTNAESEDAAASAPSEEDNKKVSKLYDNTMQKEMFTDDFKNEAENRIDEVGYLLLCLITNRPYHRTKERR